ncbi:MAG: hypothetical protein ACLFTK_00980 [Anaerolineales bacterium]
MPDDQSLAASSNALQELAHVFYDAAKGASTRIMGNLRIGALEKEASVTERFWAYMETGLDGQRISDLPTMKLSAVAFTDRGAPRDTIGVGADMACFVRYDLPGLRWAKGFLGQSKLATVHGFHENGIPRVGLHSEEDYDRLTQQCAAMVNISDESYAFFFSTESVTVEKAANLLRDLGESYPNKPWQDLHQFRKSPPVDIAQFYAAVAACQLGEAMLDKPVDEGRSVFDMVRERRIETVLLLMVGTEVPQKPLKRDSPELDALAAEVPETYWLWTDLLQTLIQR